MASSARVDRRTVLRTVAFGAAAAGLAACSSGGDGGGGAAGESRGGNGKRGSAVDQPGVPSELREAPTLTDAVEAGDLPPLAERLPERPYVIPHHWAEPGEYGGQLRIPTSGSSEASHKQYMYGHSPLRWLNDGQDIGPGLLEAWETNDDSTEWTLHLRQGLRWSDGEPCTSADVMFWWEDMVLDEEHSDVPPDFARSGKGTVMELTAPDEATLVLRFDAPAPLTAEKLADWVNRGNGATWIEPKHYLSQFHPRYEPSVSGDWASADGEFDARRDWAMNPECPTLTGWRLESFEEGRSLQWARNPYYWCVDQSGAQLPYLDGIVMEVVADSEVRRFQVQEGGFDLALGSLAGLSLSDVAGIERLSSESGMEVLQWDSGSGTGSLFLFNYDYRDDAVRELIRTPAFRQALSYAFDRKEVRSSVYYDTGRPTTGTMSPKAIEYSIDDDAREVFERWRSSYADFDPERAEAMLDDLGVVDQDGDGLRETPDGAKLAITLDYPADAADEHVQKNELLARDWRAIGIDATSNPVAPTSIDTLWSTGELMSKTAWEFAGNPNLLSFPGALVPTQVAWWAPLHGQHFTLHGSAAGPDDAAGTDPWERTPPQVAAEPDSSIGRMWQIYEQAKLEPDELKRRQAIWDITKVHVEDGPFFMGSVANPPQIVVVHNQLRNVPARDQLARNGWVNPWTHPTPAVYDPECFFWSDPSEHG